MHCDIELAANADQYQAGKNLALNLYRKSGFREIDAYRHNPHPEAVFMELKLR